MQRGEGDDARGAQKGDDAMGPPPRRSITRPVVDAALALASVFVILREAPRSLPSGVLWDYGSFVASGRAAREGLDPYGVHPLTMYVSLPGFEGWNPNLNPPISALLFQLFDLVDPQIGFRLWWVVSFGCWAATVIVLLRHHAPNWSRGALLAFLPWAFALAGVWDTLFLGQIYMPLVLAAAGAWVLLDRGKGVAAGVLVGLAAAIKPNLLVWPALLLLAGHRKPAMAAGAVFAAVSAVPLIVFGPGIYARWIALIAGDGARAGFLTNASLAGLFARAGIPGIAPVVSAALLAGAALWAFLRKPGPERASEVAIAAALLASPLAWVHYTLFLLPAFIRRRDEMWTRLPAALLIVPVPFLIDRLNAPAAVQLTTGSIYNWALIVFALVPAFAGRIETLGGRAPAANRERA